MTNTETLVTGGSGYLATHLIAALLREGRAVRATVRSAGREAGVRAAVRRGGADDAGLTVVVADLLQDDGWAAALDGCAEVHHVASPIPVAQPKDPDDLIVPAREGTLRVLRAARDAGVRRTVLTSSFAAIGYTPKPVPEFTEDDWTDPDTPGLAPYPRSKTIAERAAWSVEGVELSVVNPTFMLGPALTSTPGSSMQLVTALRGGTMPVVPRARFGIVDVRDVAELHLLVMAAPEAAGKRFLAVSDDPATSYVEVAAVLGRQVEEAPGDELPRPVIHNDRAKALGWKPRDARTTILESAVTAADGPASRTA